MAGSDLSSNIKVLPSINPAAAITGNGTTTGATIDSHGFESVTHVLQTGTVTDGSWAVTLYAGDAANMSDEAAVTAAELVGSAPSFAAADDNVVKRVGYHGPKRYTRVKAVQSGATSGGILSAVAILGHPRTAPVP